MPICDTQYIPSIFFIVISIVTEQTETKLHLCTFTAVLSPNEMREKIKLCLGTRISACNILQQTVSHYYQAGMGSSRTGLDLEDSSRTKFCGLGLEDSWPWPWPRPWPRQCTASVLRSVGKTSNLWVWLISKGLNTTIQYFNFMHKCTRGGSTASNSEYQHFC